MSRLARSIRCQDGVGMKATDQRVERFTIAEFADMLGFPVTALPAILAKNRSTSESLFTTIHNWLCVGKSLTRRFTTSCEKPTTKSST